MQYPFNEATYPFVSRVNKVVDTGNLATPQFIKTDLTIDSVDHTLDLSSLLESHIKFIFVILEGESQQPNKTAFVKSKGYSNNINKIKILTRVATKLYRQSGWLYVPSHELEYNIQTDTWNTLNIIITQVY